MKLRTATIWTTGLMLLLTAAITIIFFFHDLPKDDLDRFITLTIKGLPIVIMFSGCPLFLAWIIAMSLKCAIPTLILFISTIVYGVLYVSVTFSILMFYDHEGTGILLNVGILSLTVLLPLWIAAWIVELRHRKKNQPTPTKP